jgi:hypothetical protein
VSQAPATAAGVPKAKSISFELCGVGLSFHAAADAEGCYDDGEHQDCADEYPDL